MTTLNEMIETIKAENPNGLRVGNEVDGYTNLTASEYEATMADWANARLAKLSKVASEKALENTKKAAYEKLGLTQDEINAILG